MPENRSSDLPPASGEKVNVFWLAAALLVGMLLGAGAMRLYQPPAAAPPLLIATAAPTATPSPLYTPGPLHVYASGAVRHPAVYRLPPGSRIDALIAAAGGPSEAADLRHLNLAAPLHDGEQVYVPSVDDVCPPTITPGAEATDAAGNATTPGVIPGGKIDINHASAEALETLPGVGPAMAQRIIAARPYSKIEEIKRVRGIGDKTFQKLKPYITTK